MDSLYGIFGQAKDTKIANQDWINFIRSRTDTKPTIRGLEVDLSMNSGVRLGKHLSTLYSYALGAGALLIFAPSRWTMKLVTALPQLQNLPISDRSWRIGKMALLIVAGVTLLRHIASRLSMIGIFPAQSRIARFFTPFLRPRVCQLRDDDKTVRHIVVENKGVKYHGALYTTRDTILNGQWVLVSPGNAMTADETIKIVGSYHASANFNTLIMDGPGAGRSNGHAVPETMGDAAQAGLKYLETRIKADRICAVGISLGGLMLGEAVKGYKFSKETEYRVVKEISFTRISDFGSYIGSQIGAMVGDFGASVAGFGVKHIVHFLGLEMDSIAASHKLTELGIHEYIFNAGTLQESGAVQWSSDGLIPEEISHAKVAEEEKMKNKTLAPSAAPGHSPEFQHMSGPIRRMLTEWDSQPRAKVVGGSIG